MQKNYEEIGFLEQIYVPYWRAGKTVIDDHQFGSLFGRS